MSFGRGWERKRRRSRERRRTIRIGVARKFYYGEVFFVDRIV